MRTRPLFLFNLFFSFTVLISSTSFADVQLVIKDQNDKPLANAVIEVVGGQTIEDDSIATIDQINKRFVPDFLVINRGQSVDFPNSDNIRHHVYSFSQAKWFELKLYADKPEKPIEFDQNGIVVLGCNIHDTMVGYIYVTNSLETYVSDAQGNVTLPDMSADTYVTLWHAHQKLGPESVKQMPLASLINNNHEVIIEIVPPQPRNSFGDVFVPVN